MDWKFKENVEPIGSDDFFYDITDGGYINYKELLDDPKQIKKLSEAINLLLDFQDALVREGIYTDSGIG